MTTTLTRAMVEAEFLRQARLEVDACATMDEFYETIVRLHADSQCMLPLLDRIERVKRAYDSEE